MTQQVMGDTSVCISHITPYHWCMSKDDDNDVVVVSADDDFYTLFDKRKHYEQLRDPLLAVSKECADDEKSKLFVPTNNNNREQRIDSATSEGQIIMVPLEKDFDSSSLLEPCASTTHCIEKHSSPTIETIMDSSSLTIGSVVDGYNENDDNSNNYQPISNHSVYPQQHPVAEDWTSNVLFLVGSILYVWLSIWDLINAYNESENDEKTTTTNDDDHIFKKYEYNNKRNYSTTNDSDDYKNDGATAAIDQSNSVLVMIWTLAMSSPYCLLSVLAASCYVVDASFQITKLLCHRQHHSHQEQPHQQEHNNNNNNHTLSTPLNDSINNDNDVHDINIDIEIEPNNDHYFYHNHAHIPLLDADDYDYYSTELEVGSTSIDTNRCCWKRHLQPTKRCIVPALVAITFGGAALSQLIASWIMEWDSQLSQVLWVIGAHFYLMNAVILNTQLLVSLCDFRHANNDSSSSRKKFGSSRNNRSNSRCHCSSGRLEYFGDLLFLIGTTIDVLICYWDLETTSTILVSWFSLLSSLLWLADAIFYIIADCLGPDDYAYQFEEEEEDHDNSNQSDDNIVIVSTYESNNYNVTSGTNSNDPASEQLMMCTEEKKE